LTEDELYLNKASQLAERMLPAFETPSGLPPPSVNLMTMRGVREAQLSLSEPTSLQLEFRSLARATKRPGLRTAVDRVMDVVQKLPKKDGLLPLAGLEGGLNGRMGLGARGDSYYEYLLKQWLLTNRTEKRYLQAYQEAVQGVRKHLVKHTVGKGVTFVAEGDIKQGATELQTVPKMDHLVCFLPGVLALGSWAGAGDTADLELAEELIEGCWMMYNSTKTGIAPEIAQFELSGHKRDIWIKPNDAFSRLRPETLESLFVLWRVTKNTKYRDWGWSIYQAIEKHARVPTGGYAIIKNVDSLPVVLEDKMESFFLAETLKYLYLLFSGPELFPLDKFVFNTEAHVMPIWTPQK